MSADNWELRDFAQGGGRGLGRSSPLLTLFLLLLAVMMAAGIAWASWARIEEVARADGRVVPSGRARLVESLEGGIVRDIHVREGDRIAAGDVLVTIDDTGTSANLGELLAQQSALTARSHRLEAEAAGAETIDFSDTVIDPATPQARRETTLFTDRLASYLGQQAVLQAQVVQRRQAISEIETTLPQVDGTLALLDEEIRLRSDSGVVSRAQILPLERERLMKQQERDSLDAGLSQARSALVEAEARVDELRLQRQSEISTELSDALNQLQVVGESIRRASDVVARANLRAPVDGIVSVLNVNTIGSVIAPGEEVLRIVPENDSLQVDARARPEDIAFLHVGLPAKVKLTSFDFTIYGALDGSVIRVGADAEQDEATGNIYFPIVVETADNRLSHNGQSFEIRPGMVASVDILTGEHTILDYLLKPFRKARMDALRER